MTGKLFTANSVGAQVRREVGRFLSKQLSGLRTLFASDRAENDRAEDYEGPPRSELKMDNFSQFRFFSLKSLTLIVFLR